MIYVDIDISKLKHFASSISFDGEILMGVFRFTYDGDGSQLFVSNLNSFESDNIIIDP